jgi:hypothetical protein
MFPFIRKPPRSDCSPLLRQDDWRSRVVAVCVAWRDYCPADNPVGSRLVRWLEHSAGVTGLSPSHCWSGSEIQRLAYFLHHFRSPDLKGCATIVEQHSGDLRRSTSCGGSSRRSTTSLPQRSQRLAVDVELLRSRFMRAMCRADTTPELRVRLRYAYAVRVTRGIRLNGTEIRVYA